MKFLWTTINIHKTVWKISLVTLFNNLFASPKLILVQKCEVASSSVDTIRNVQLIKVTNDLNKFNGSNEGLHQRAVIEQLNYDTNCRVFKIELSSAWEWLAEVEICPIYLMIPNLILRVNVEKLIEAELTKFQYLILKTS